MDSRSLTPAAARQAKVALLSNYAPHVHHRMLVPASALSNMFFKIRRYRDRCPAIRDTRKARYSGGLGSHRSPSTRAVAHSAPHCLAQYRLGAGRVADSPNTTGMLTPDPKQR